MNNLVQTVQNIFRIDELKQRIIYTAIILIVARIGSYIALPGVDVAVIEQIQAQGKSGGDIFALADLFVGGALSNAAIFALGIMPYISASIIFQLAGIVMPSVQKMQKEGEDGRRKINQWTRIATVFVAAIQGWAVANSIMSNKDGMVVPDPGVGFILSSIFVLTAGTIFMMWLGEQITERGIGNGISLIIFIGIIARLPDAFIGEFERIFVPEFSNPDLIGFLITLAALVGVVAAVVLITQGARRIPVQYAKRVVGKKVMGGTTQYIPLRVNTAGVMPIIFAQALLFVPGILAELPGFNESPFMISFVNSINNPTHWLHVSAYSVMIVFFTYFYTAVAFNPKDVADNIKKQGGFIPGIRPGAPTSEYIENILTKITLPGAVFLALVAVLPGFAIKFFGVTDLFGSFFGGTSVLIVVGVALDTLQRIESYLQMRHYDGFMKSGKIRGRANVGIGGQ